MLSTVHAGDELSWSLNHLELFLRPGVSRSAYASKSPKPFANALRLSEYLGEVGSMRLHFLLLFSAQCFSVTPTHADDALSPAAKTVLCGEAQFKHGESKPWRAVKSAAAATGVHVSQPHMTWRVDVSTQASIYPKSSAL
jgi:hypothetical protein